jgi:hypothetical protein
MKYMHALGPRLVLMEVNFLVVQQFLESTKIVGHHEPPFGKDHAGNVVGEHNLVGGSVEMVLEEHYYAIVEHANVHRKHASLSLAHSAFLSH